MLLKKIKLGKGLIDDDSFSRKTIIFHRVYGPNTMCFDPKMWVNGAVVNDLRCKYHKSCPIKYSCSIINRVRYENYAYIPTV